ncbi:10637_t:CDS:2 [Scutellospora calospora]|uniref:10637_t:CDS:1 n=1 Tax=Scutellospora calospora TaxID=85575 RepID=A0ACA9JUS8_9GLOM|nr:10637_t:CDS:2 [Scutellospora calospora]
MTSLDDLDPFLTLPDNSTIRIPTPTLEGACTLIDDTLINISSSPIPNITNSLAFFVFYLQCQKLLTEKRNTNLRSFMHNLSLIASISWRKAHRDYTEGYDRLYLNSQPFSAYIVAGADEFMTLNDIIDE